MNKRQVLQFVFAVVVVGISLSVVANVLKRKDSEMLEIYILGS